MLSTTNETDMTKLKELIIGYSGHTKERKTNLYNLINDCINKLNITTVFESSANVAIHTGKNKLFIYAPYTNFLQNKTNQIIPDTIYTQYRLSDTLNLLPAQVGLPIQIATDDNRTIIGFDPINNLLIIPSIQTMLSIPIEIKTILEKITSGDISSIGNIIGDSNKRHISNVQITYEIMPKHKLNKEVNNYKKILSENYKKRIESISTLLNKKIKEVEENLERLPEKTLLDKNKLVCLIPNDTISGHRILVIGKQFNIKVVSLEFANFSLNMIPLDYKIEGILGGIFDSKKLIYERSVCVSNKLVNNTYIQNDDNPHIYDTDLTNGMCTGDADVKILQKPLTDVISSKWFDKLISQTKKINMSSLAIHEGKKFFPVYKAATEIKNYLYDKLNTDDMKNGSEKSQKVINNLLHKFNDELETIRNTKLDIIKTLHNKYSLDYNLINDAKFNSINYDYLIADYKVKLVKGITFGKDAKWGSSTSSTDSKGWSTKKRKVTEVGKTATIQSSIEPRFMGDTEDLLIR